MRIFLIIASASVATIAVAEPAPTYSPYVDVGSVEPSCRPLARIPNTSAPGPSFDAAISTASCVAVTRTRNLTIEPSERGVQMLDEAVAPALAIYDRVIAAGDPEHALIATYAKLDLLRGNIARLLDAVPDASPQMTANETAEHERAVMAVGVLVQPWQRRADASRRHLTRIANLHPELATRDAVLAYMIRSARLGEPIGIAAR